MSTLNSLGQEVLDETPVAYPLQFDRPTPLHLRIRNMILQAMQETGDNETESIEEANDFTLPDDPETFVSPYEEEDNFDHMQDVKWENVVETSSETSKVTQEENTTES